jgi:hypothetical protein
MSSLLTSIADTASPVNDQTSGALSRVSGDSTNVLPPDELKLVGAGGTYSGGRRRRRKSSKKSKKGSVKKARRSRRRRSIKSWFSM